MRCNLAHFMPRLCQSDIAYRLLQKPLSSRFRHMAAHLSLSIFPGPNHQGHQDCYVQATYAGALWDLGDSIRLHHLVP